MSRPRWLVFAAALVVASFSSDLAARQLPDATTAQIEAGSRVASVELTPESISIVRGDTFTVTPRFLDRDGRPVDGVQGITFPSIQGLSPVTPPVGPGPYTFVSESPDSGSIIVFVRVADEDGSFQGINGVKQVASLPVRVSDWPAARIEIAELAYTPYTGTTFRLDGKVFTDRDTEHSSARISWRSETPDIASISSSGVLRSQRAGQARIVASTDNAVTQQLMLDVLENPVRQLDVTRQTQQHAPATLYSSMSARLTLMVVRSRTWHLPIRFLDSTPSADLFSTTERL